METPPENIPPPPEPDSSWPYAKAINALSGALDSIVEVDRVIASAMAERTRLIDSTSRLALAALGSGEISYRHAQTIVDHAVSLPVRVREEFETEVLPAGRTQTVAKLERRACSLRERLHPSSVDERHGAAEDDRFVAVKSARGGMAWLTAYPFERRCGSVL